MMHKVPIFDTHVHIWDTDYLSIPWLKEFKDRLPRHCELNDYVQASAGFNVRQIAYVEVDVAKDDNLDKEADFISSLCAKDNLLACAVIGADLTSEHFSDYIKQYASNPYIVGVRHGGIGFSSGDIFLTKIFVNNVKLLGELNLNFELVCLPKHIVQANELTSICPQTQFIINHCGFISPQEQDTELVSLWKRGIKTYAEQSNTICKISGLLQGVKEATWTKEELEPIINFCIDAFGEDRVVFASNWPVCNLHGSFKQWLQALEWIIRKRSEKFKHKFFHQNAEKYYIV